MKPSIHDKGEHALINHLTHLFSKKTKSLKQGVGDDAAVVTSVHGKDIVMTTDMLIEGQHFRSKWATWKEIGIKAMEVNLSDLAAMGSKPLYVLLSLGLPPKTPLKDIEDFYQGVRKSLKPYGAIVIGGDMNNSPKGWIVSVTMMGESAQGKIPLRAQAKSGDDIYVTGYLGYSALGLCGLKKNKKTSTLKPFLKKHLLPQARVSLGLKLRSHVHAMIDVSDGLVQDLGHILKQSRKGAVIGTEDLLMKASFVKEAQKLKQKPISLALTGGEDYELLFTAKVKKRSYFKRLSEKQGVPITRIGIIKAQKGLQVLDGKGRQITLQCEGYRHF